MAKTIFKVWIPSEYFENPVIYTNLNFGECFIGCPLEGHHHIGGLVPRAAYEKCAKIQIHVGGSVLKVLKEDSHFM